MLMHYLRLFPIALLRTLLLLAGCQPPGNKFEKQFAIPKFEPNDQKFFIMPAIEKDEQVLVSADTNNVKVDIYIVKAQDEDGARDIIDKRAVKDIQASK